MDRIGFHKVFKTPGPVILPVIHLLDTAQAEENLRIVIGEGAAGAFLINHDFSHQRMVPILRRIRGRFPALWLGVNFLAVTGRDAFPILGQLQRQDCPIDAYWADDARIDERRPPHDQAEAAQIAAARLEAAWPGLYFGGTAFKKQRPVPAAAYAISASLAATQMDVVTTSGIATGQEADIAKIAAFRQGLGNHALALASGVTPENAARYGTLADCFLVATGINYPGDFYRIDPYRLAGLLKIARAQGKQKPEDEASGENRDD